MRRLALVLLLAAAACISSTPPSTTPAPGRAALSVEVRPNPIVATLVSGDSYNFPFEVIVRETGGQAVNINRVTAVVRAPGGFTVASESWDAARIRSLGFATSIPANGEVRYRFSQRHSVPDERLFGGVAAELRVDAVDPSGAATNATTSVTVRKG